MKITNSITRIDNEIIISKANSQDTNHNENNYLAVTNEVFEKLNYYLRRGMDINVSITQYLTKSDKKKNRPHQKIKKSVKKLEKLGLKTTTSAGDEYYRVKLLMVDTKYELISKTVIPRVITTGTICSGIGAAEESFKQLGFNKTNHRNLFMCEYDQDVSNIYKQNFKSENYFGDFYKTDWSKVMNHHLHILLISTPCQEFSLANSNRKGLDSEKGQLYVDALIKARELSPDKIINENVSSIISSGKHYSKIKKEDGTIEELNYIPNEKTLKKKKWTLLKSQKNKYVYKSRFNPKLKIGRNLKIVEDMLLRDFKDYNIYMDVLNTRDFGKTPQNRKRFFLVMIKKTLDYGFEYPTPRPLETKLIDLFDNVEKIGDSLIVNDREIVKYDKEEPKNPKQLHEYGVALNKDGSFPEHRASSAVYYPRVSPCLTTKGHTKIYDPRIDKVRFLSPDEQKRVHGFREDFIIPTDNFELSSFVMGNTISPSVLTELLKNVLFTDLSSTHKINEIPKTSGNEINYQSTTKKEAA